ncbi:MAG TPA: alpha-L-fucosidase, partial [Chitinophagaceae bacterium]|nr:alpha-L-fucosidase [Chitinophagaceae bacterium]
MTAKRLQQALSLFIPFLFILSTSTRAQTKALPKDTASPGIPVHDAPVNGPVNALIGEAGNSTGFDMAPETTRKVVEQAVEELPVQMPAGPFEPSWSSLQANYKVPQWFIGAKFGLFMHWGLFSVPAYKSEWYEKHMYGNKDIMAWHAAHFGPQDKFGYKDFIPLF